MRLLAESPRRPGARRFGTELRRAMKAGRRTQRGLAIEAGVGRTRLIHWLNGEALPPVEVANELADILMWPSLVVVCADARKAPCAECGREFIASYGSPQVYCSTECRRAHVKVAGGSRDLSRSVLERRTKRYAAAVAAMCAACEPTGVCRTVDCPLQVAGVSPLVLGRDA